MYGYRSFCLCIHPFEHLSFYFLAIIGKTAMNIHVQVFAQTLHFYFSWDYAYVGNLLGLLLVTIV